jgi:hypothetical protein
MTRCISGKLEIDDLTVKRLALSARRRRPRCAADHSHGDIGGTAAPTPGRSWS